MKGKKECRNGGKAAFPEKQKTKIVVKGKSGSNSFQRGGDELVA